MTVKRSLTWPSGDGKRFSLSLGERHFGQQNHRGYHHKDDLLGIVRERGPGSGHLAEFFMSESQRLTMGVICPFSGYGHVVHCVP